jgi:hypothetical protein
LRDLTRGFAEVFGKRFIAGEPGRWNGLIDEKV